MSVELFDTPLELTDTSVDRLVVNAAGLEETKWPPFKVDSSETEVETSGLESVVSDLLVQGLLMSFTCVEAPSAMELVSCLVVRWVFTESDNRSLLTLKAELVLV